MAGALHLHRWEMELGSGDNSGTRAGMPAVGGGGGGGGRPRGQPPSQKGQFRKGTDGQISERCICCKLEGAALPADTGRKTNPKLTGLEMLGHPGPQKGKGKDSDIRFAPWSERGISWVKKRSATALECRWPTGTGPMCFKCAKKCRTLPCGNVLPAQHLESARREWRLCGKSAPPYIYSCVAADGSYVEACDPLAQHGPVALPPGINAGMRDAVPRNIAWSRS
jgi:hypothetical protein